MTHSTAFDLSFPKHDTKDTILESQKLIQKLFSVVKGCKHCTAKLKKNMVGVPLQTPSQPTAPAIGMLSLNERERTST